MPKEWKEKEWKRENYHHFVVKWFNIVQDAKVSLCFESDIRCNMNDLLSLTHWLVIVEYWTHSTVEYQLNTLSDIVLLRSSNQITTPIFHYSTWYLYLYRKNVEMSLKLQYVLRLITRILCFIWTFGFFSTFQSCYSISDAINRFTRSCFHDTYLVKWQIICECDAIKMYACEDFAHF